MRDGAAERPGECGPEGKIIIRLPRPLPSQYNCLPHAAMNLGGRGGVGLQPAVRMISTLVIEPQLGAWIFYRLDAEGGYVEDSWHPTRQDALHQAEKEFGVEPEETCRRYAENVERKLK